MRQLKITNKITNRESVALEKYLTDIAKIDLISADDEIRLAKLIREGDQDALEKLTKANLRFVVSVAKQYQNQGLSLPDLINEGNVGLMKAAKRFDETKGFKFISYAVWWIRQSILAAIVEYSRIVRLPLNKVTSYNKVNEAHVKFTQQYEREPSHEELAEILDVKVKDVSNMLRGGNRHVSMDAPINSDEGAASRIDLYSLGEEDSPDLELMEQSLADEISHGLSLLSPREVEIISYYFGLNGKSTHTLDEIGDMFGLTRERVRQIRERAIKRLRRSVNRNALKSYLG
jgi:RNA polymerase primary sigma factor